MKSGGGKVELAGAEDQKPEKKYILRKFQSVERFEGNVLSGVALMNLGIARKILGDTDGAISQFQRARSHFEEAGDLARLAEVHHLLEMTFLAKQLSPDALKEFEQCTFISLNASSQTLRGLAFLGKAHAFYFLGDSRTALTLTDRCLDSFSICQDRMYLADVYKLKGIIHREIHREEFARWYLFTSLKINLELENTIKVGSCHYELGRLHLQRGKASEAKRAFQKSVQCFKKVGASHEVERASIELQSMKKKPTDEFRRPRKKKI